MVDAIGPDGMELTFHQLVELVREDRYHYSSHAEGRMAARGITDAHVKEAILAGEVLETYSHDARGRSYLALGFPVGRPLHIQAGYNRYRGLAIIITVYVPEPPKWVTPRQRGT